MNLVNRYCTKRHLISGVLILKVTIDITVIVDHCLPLYRQKKQRHLAFLSLMFSALELETGHV